MLLDEYDTPLQETYVNDYWKELADFIRSSSFDTGNKPSEEQEPERFYHVFVLGLIVDLAEKYRITSNRKSGFAFRGKKVLIGTEE